ncbi:uncharacterized protein N7483_006522 [Penicillium malachiteum]|uniref:uncharacterized protein n=1 Tax=Penicillium malachiteum TaxID=1324776 RepID=UPI002547000D|nr:uncharacterized protein N7483_006522 [Penicillium malachiteum]KAJ5725165.1 hypothetical protein N7483_006522 [Penicillium malachiteum]
MRIQSHRAPLLLSALLSGFASAVSFKCSDIKTSDHTFDFSGLKGTHEVFHSSTNETEGFLTNTTYVLNICDVLHGAANRDGITCGTTRNVCGFSKRIANDTHHSNSVYYPIAGLDHVGEGSKDPVATPLKEINENEEGLRLRMAGGEYEAESGKKSPAAAIIDFVCDPDRSGLEGIPLMEDENGEKDMQRRDGEDPVRDPSLTFKSFGPDADDTFILKLDWRTRVFLCVAAYLIFGSWLNYNRYGARGWDLLPHGDTLRDVPYIFQDWVRRVVNTLQGSGSRGGYSAV